MSGVRPKGPERPQQQRLKVQNKVPEPAPGDADTPPPVTSKPLLEGRVPVISWGYFVVRVPRDMVAMGILRCELLYIARGTSRNIDGLLIEAV